MRNIISSSLIITSLEFYILHIFITNLIGLTYADSFRGNILRNERERNM